MTKKNIKRTFTNTNKHVHLRFTLGSIDKQANKFSVTIGGKKMDMGGREARSIYNFLSKML